MKSYQVPSQDQGHYVSVSQYFLTLLLQYSKMVCAKNSKSTQTGKVFHWWDCNCNFTNSAVGNINAILPLMVKFIETLKRFYLSAYVAFLSFACLHHLMSCLKSSFYLNLTAVLNCCCLWNPLTVIIDRVTWLLHLTGAKMDWMIKKETESCCCFNQQ